MLDEHLRVVPKDVMNGKGKRLDIDVRSVLAAKLHMVSETRQKHPFLSPPVTMVPTERFHQMLQDTLRGPVLASLPFYEQKKVIALLDELPAMSDVERIGWDPVLMSILSACVIQQRFGLGANGR
jgi:hypothetical protein